MEDNPSWWAIRHGGRIMEDEGTAALRSQSWGAGGITEWSHEHSDEMAKVLVDAQPRFNKHHKRHTP